MSGSFGDTPEASSTRHRCSIALLFSVVVPDAVAIDLADYASISMGFDGADHDRPPQPYASIALRRKALATLEPRRGQLEMNQLAICIDLPSAKSLTVK